MITVAIILFLVLALVVSGLLLGIVINIRQRLAECKTAARVLAVSMVALSAVILLRPHEDTFAGLDNSGYRLMARAFQAGRQMHAVDRSLLEAPRDIRNKFMLLPTMEERNTRDRSFLVKSLDTGETEPFFYPLLPLCAAGFDALVPGDALDYLVPTTGLILVIACILVGAAYGGCLGILVAMALLAGSPLPAWLLRGFYVESAASVLLALSLLCWLARPEGRRVSRFAYLALGLAVSFHPAMVVISLPLLMVFVLSPEERPRDVISGLLLFGAGFSVMAGMLVYACSPYGGLSWSALKFNFLVSASHRITLLCGGLMAIVTLIAVLAKPVWSGWYGRLSDTSKYAVSCIPPALGVVPILLAAGVWSQKAYVRQGLLELESGVRLWLGLLSAVFCAQILVSRSSTRARMALAVVFFALPVFAYLKGAEQMGLWSQRRLLPVYILAVISLLPASAEWLKNVIWKSPRPMNFLAAFTAGSLLLMAGGANPCRWSAPYTVRCDKGAWNWVEKVRAKIGGRLVVFDYYPYSVPFSVTGQTRALGLGESARHGFAGIAGWLADKAGKEEVLLATAYSNPGMEEGVTLKESFSESFQLNKVASKGALPAKKKTQTADLMFLRVAPVGDNQPLPVLRKVFDDGPLALRGHWGAGRPIEVNGRMLPSRWSREGGGLIGPVPPSGQAIRITMEAAAARDDGEPGQTMKIRPPWGGEDLLLAVSNQFCSVSGMLVRPADQKDDGKKTGLYRIYSVKPYDPSKAGVKGYDRDLGARIHLIQMECLAGGSSKER